MTFENEVKSIYYIFWSGSMIFTEKNTNFLVLLAIFMGCKLDSRVINNVYN
jgi:hypothetical protein